MSDAGLVPGRCAGSVAETVDRLVATITARGTTDDPNWLAARHGLRGGPER